MFNDFWMIDNGFIERESFGDVRDLISRRHLEREDFTLKPATPVSQAVKQMRLYDVSQMAVLDEHDKVIGIIDESDVLLATASNAIVVGFVVTTDYARERLADPVLGPAIRNLSMTRTGEPRDIANAALFLASDESAFVTASTLFVDGGMTAKTSLPRPRVKFPQAGG